MKKKWNRTLKAGTAVVLAVSMVSGGPVAGLAVTASAQEEVKEDVTADIYPKPQKVEYASKEGMKFDGEVDLVVRGDQDEATVTKIKEVLDEEQIPYQESDEVSKDKAAILITTEKEDQEALGVADDAALQEEQGYVLQSENDENKKGQVTIVASDEDGAYYGVLTLEQILDQKAEDGAFAEAEISDYPSIKLRGFVEGFYGFPWSFEERLSMIKESSEYKVNTYIYAPKDDPYHKDQWRTLYPEDKAEEIRKLVEESKKDNVSFCWSAHPGSGFNYNNDNDFNALIAKFEQLYSLGVRQFGISYDDLSGYVSGTQHATIINRVNQEFVKKKGDVKPLIVVATRYCNSWGSSMQTYFKPFMETLDEDVVVMWTGADTMSAITKDSYEWPKQQTGVNRDLAAWWNYPVNDYCEGNLMMAPLEILDNDVDNLSGFFLNPMCQAEASKVAIFSGADYAWNVTGFEYMDSWKRAIKELVPEAQESFERFADNLSFIKEGSTFAFDESRYLTDKLEALTEALKTGKNIRAVAQALRAEFETMKADAEVLKQIENKGLLEEIEVSLSAYDAVADAGIAAMDGFIGACDGDVEKTLESIDVMNAKLDESETYKIAYMTRYGATDYKVAKVGEKRLKPMIRDAASQIQSVLAQTVNPEVKCRVFTEKKNLSDYNVTFKGGNYSVETAEAVLKAGDYIAFNLPKVRKVSEISLTSEQADSLQLQYSLNGIDWVDAQTEVQDGVLKSTEAVTAAYVRVKNRTEEAVKVQVSDFMAAIVYSIGTAEAATDLGTYGSYRISNAVDGNMRTKFYSSSGTSVGSYVRVDLKKSIPLYDLKICYAPNPKGLQEGVDGFKATKVEVSTDAVTWKQIGDIIPYTDYTLETLEGQSVASVSYNAEGEMARYIRFSATESYENWIQVYEVLYNKSVSNIGDDSVDLVDASFDVQGAENLYDGDLQTAAEASGITAGDTLTFPMTAITNVKDLTIVQDKDTICSAAVSVKDVDGNWTEVGKLDKQVNSFKVDSRISEVKLTFDGSADSMKISEIFVKEKQSATRTGLETLFNTWIGQDLSEYTKESADVLTEALKAAKEVLDSREDVSDEVFWNATQSLIDAIKGLEYGVQKTHLKVMIEQAEELLAKENDYEEADVNEVKAALKAAKEVYDNEDAGQDAVDDAMSTLLLAIQKISKKADVESLESLIEVAKKLTEKENYTEASKDKLKEAIEKAEAVLDDQNRDADAVAKAYDEIIDAVAGLQLKANKAALRAMIAKAEEVLGSKDAYVAETLEGLEEVFDAAKAVDDNAEAIQSEVNAAVKELTAKLAELRLKGDVNGDGYITSGDAADVLNAAAELTDLSAADQAAADVNGDGNADTSDAVLILQYAAEKIKAF